MQTDAYAGEMIAPIHSPASHIYFLTDGVANVNMVELKSAPYHFGEVCGPEIIDPILN